MDNANRGPENIRAAVGVYGAATAQRAASGGAPGVPATGQPHPRRARSRDRRKVIGPRWCFPGWAGVLATSPGVIPDPRAVGSPHPVTGFPFASTRRPRPVYTANDSAVAPPTTGIGPLLCRFAGQPVVRLGAARRAPAGARPPPAIPAQSGCRNVNRGSHPRCNTRSFKSWPHGAALRQHSDRIVLGHTESLSSSTDTHGRLRQPPNSLPATGSSESTTEADTTWPSP